MRGLGGEGSRLLTPRQAKGAAALLFRQPQLDQDQEHPLGQLCIDVSPLSIVIAPFNLLQEWIDPLQYLHTLHSKYIEKA